MPFSMGKQVFFLLNAKKGKAKIKQKTTKKEQGGFRAK